MKRIAVIGGGVAGLTVARLVRERFETVLFERNPKVGGLIACETCGGHLFHRCGGHVFNSRNRAVLDWFWSMFDSARDFRKADRHAVIALNGQLVDYPIEFSVRRLSPELQASFLRDLSRMETAPCDEPHDFDAFLRARFGQTLYGLYFGPYNRKIWQCDLRTIPLDWMEGKLPLPTPQDLRNAYEHPVRETSFVHSSFWYPRRGGSQFIADTLSAGTDVRLSTAVDAIRLRGDRRLDVNGEPFDGVFFCGNIRELPILLRGLDCGDLGRRLEALPAHGTTTAFCEVDRVPYSWMYQPDPNHDSHRMIFTGNFSPANNRGERLSASVEFTGRLDETEIRRQLGRMPLHPELLGCCRTDCSYPIQTPGTRATIGEARDLLRRHRIYLVGRFAEWEYLNMDAVMASAMKTVECLSDSTRDEA